MAHRLAPEAEAELDDIWYYVAKESGSLDVADRFVESLTGRFYLLARNPYLGRRRDADLRPGLRSFPVGNYLILYRLDGEDVLVLHIIRGVGILRHCSVFRRRREARVCFHSAVNVAPARTSSAQSSPKPSPKPAAARSPPLSRAGSCRASRPQGRIVNRHRRIRHSRIKILEHLFVRIVVAFAVTARQIRKRRRFRIKQRSILDDDLVWFVAMPDPQRVGLLLVPRHARFRAENLERKPVLAAGRHLAHRERPSRAIAQMQHHHAEIFRGDRKRLVFAGAAFLPENVSTEPFGRLRVL